VHLKLTLKCRRNGHSCPARPISFIGKRGHAAHRAPCAAFESAHHDSLQRSRKGAVSARAEVNDRASFSATRRRLMTFAHFIPRALPRGLYEFHGPTAHKPQPRRSGQSNPSRPAAGPSPLEAGGILTVDLSAIFANTDLRALVVPGECAAVGQGRCYGCGNRSGHFCAGRPAAAPSLSPISTRRPRSRANARECDLCSQWISLLGN